MRWRRCRANGSAAERRPYLESTSALARGVDLEFGSEGFEVGAGDGAPEKVREFFGVDDCLDFLTQTLWHSLEADFQRFEDVLLLGEDQTFLAAFLMAFLATFLAELFGE